MAKHGTQMTTEEQVTIKSLLAAGLTATMIAKRIGRDHHTVLSFARQGDTQLEVSVLRENLADSFEGLAHRLVDSITDEDIQKINAYQRTLSAGIAIDKCRLLREQSTTNVAVVIKDIAAIKAAGGIISNHISALDNDK